MYRNILREAIRLAKAHKAKLVLLHVVDEYVAFLNLEPGAISEDLVQAMMRRGRGVLRKAQARADEIVRQAEKLHCDLIVLGTHGP